MSILLMIVLVIDYVGVTLHELESYPPITGHLYTSYSFHSFFQLMKI
jgi:hypothetical protein